ncbi:Imm9 family immunity protein [Comamonas squillarum]|uniref:Imm9 family immunity protein n=1 Tax=Comamonas squillarum TaxID=2977320 RepID=UPI00391FC549
MDGILFFILLCARQMAPVFIKTRRYPSDHRYEFPISTPIPGSEDADYGVSEVANAFFLSLNENNFYIKILCIRNTKHCVIMFFCIHC